MSGIEKIILKFKHLYLIISKSLDAGYIIFFFKVEENIQA